MPVLSVSFFKNKYRKCSLSDICEIQKHITLHSFVNLSNSFDPSQSRRRSDESFPDFKKMPLHSFWKRIFSSE